MFERSINHFKIKYAILTENFHGGQGLKKKKYVNLFINLESVLRQLTKRFFMEQADELSKEGQLEVIYETISGLFNLAGHYRTYFRSKEVFSNIFFYYGSFDDCDYNNSVYIPNYRHNYFKRYCKDREYSDRLIKMIRIAIDKFSEYASYADSLYVLSSGKIEPSVIPFIVMNRKEYNQGINFILSEDEYDLQYTIYNGIILNPKSEFQKVISKFNAINYIKNKYGISSTLDEDVNVRLIPLMYSILGFEKDRNIPKLPKYGMRKIYKQIEKLYTLDIVDDGDENTFLIENIAEFIHGPTLINDSPKADIGNNYFSIDVARQFSVCNRMDLCTIDDQLIDNYDIKSLKDLNDRTFDHYNCPIILDYLKQYHGNYI